MKAGRLDRLITIQTKTETVSAAGGVTQAWATIAQRRPASVSPVRGDERFATPQIVAADQTEFRIRYSSNVAALHAGQHRVIYPALTDAEVAEGGDVATNRIFDIAAVHEAGRLEGLRLIANRQADVTG